MNRIEMADEIRTRVPVLARQEKDAISAADRLRQQFVTDYPVERLEALHIDDYVIGKGKHTFCYRLERGLRTSGSILGYQAFKFGIYFGKEKNDPTARYRFKPEWGETPEVAFGAVKDAIIKLLAAASKDDSDGIAHVRLTPMYKGKLLATYFPDVYAPIFSGEHLKRFVGELNLSGILEDEPAMQRALMRYRETWPELRGQSPLLFMKFLYSVSRLAGNAETAGSTPSLEEAINGAQVITQVPAATSTTAGGDRPPAKVDFEEHTLQSKRIGDRGEGIVFELEKRRLRASGRHDLAEMVEHVSQKDDGAGFDIGSFDADGTPRHIEVKSTSADDMGSGFFLSENERAKSATLPNYYLCLVFRAMSKKPRILLIKSPQFSGGGFEIRPITYLVTPR